MKNVIHKFSYFVKQKNPELFQIYSEKHEALFCLGVTY